MTAVSPLDYRAAGSGPADLRRSPLGARRAEFSAASSPLVTLAEEPFLSQVNVRVAPESPAVAELARALGFGLPLRTPNRVTTDGPSAVLWLGPDEWLVVAPDGQTSAIVPALRSALGEAVGSVVDVSANRTTLRLAGRKAREVLEKVCALDLHPRSFRIDYCAQTLVGRTQAVLWQVTEEPGYRLLVRCSFADYLADLLLDAMAEFNGNE